ncbi:MAG: DMT family transporter [Spongiibacteraceae bacterium]
MPQNHTRSLLSLYLAAILLSCNGLFAKGIPLDSVSIAQLRSIVAVIAVLVLFSVQRKSWRLPSSSDYIKTYCLGALLGLHWITFFASMQVSTVAIGMVALYSYPVITVIIEPALDKKWPHLSDIFAALIVLIGVLVMIPETSSEGGWQLNTTTLAGVGLGLISAVLFSVRNTLQRRLLTNIDASSSTLHQFLIIGVVLIPFVDWESVSTFKPYNYAQIIGLGVVTTALAHSLLVASLRHLSAKTVAMIGCIQPPVAALIAWLVLGEQPVLLVIIGGAIVLSVAVFETLRPYQPPRK